MQLSSNAIKILEARYLRKDDNGEIIESPEEMIKRVAMAIAEAELLWGTSNEVEKYYQRFRTMMSNLEFLPNSPTLMNAGTSLNQLSACFVLPVADSMESIFETLKKTALIQKSGGGTGFNFSHLRPEGALVQSTKGQSSGPVAFMEIYDIATEKIKQGGKRRGANMGILNVNHPDIFTFIRSKHNEEVLKNFNISVGVFDNFFEALKNNKDYTLTFQLHNEKIIRQIPAGQLWNEIIENAWSTGDPGLIFLDEINRKNPVPAHRIEATNPCGEVPLEPYESCNLGSVNLSKMLKYENGKYTINWEKLEEVVALAIRFLDNVIEVNNYLFPEIEQTVKGNRKIGLGVMGWAEMLIKLEIPYESKQAVTLAEKIMKFIDKTAKQTSSELAQIRGNFPNISLSIYHRNPMRNATRTSIAPTGTISIIAGTTSSIEPLFALAYKRENVLSGNILYTVNQAALETLRKQKNYSQELLDEVIATGSVQQIAHLPDTVKQLLKTSLEIDYTFHIAHQTAFQKYVDNAVSKTINLPESATRKNVEKAFLTAWKKGAKGITVYRYNSKKQQVLNSGMKSEDEVKMIEEQEIHDCKNACQL